MVLAELTGLSFKAWGVGTSTFGSKGMNPAQGARHLLPRGSEEH